MSTSEPEEEPVITVEGYLESARRHYEELGEEHEKDQPKERHGRL